jgi:hypothetical protein
MKIPSVKVRSELAKSLLSIVCIDPRYIKLQFDVIMMILNQPIMWRVICFAASCEEVVTQC